MTYEEFLIDQALKNSKIIILTAENRAAMRKLPSLVTSQFIDTGITEQTLVGVSAGLALRGNLPISHALAAFLTMRSFEFIRTDIGISKLPVILVGSFAGFLSEANGPTHQAIEDISLMRGIPKMGIFCPADETELVMGMEQIVNSGRPFYVRYNPLPAKMKHSKFELGKSEIIMEGTEVAILTYGMMVNQVKEAGEILHKRGIPVRVVNLRCLKPLDKELIEETLKKYSLVITVEDHFQIGGLFSILSEYSVKTNLFTKILPLSLKNKWFKPALLNDVLEFEGFTGTQIANKIENYFIKMRTEYYGEWSYFQ